MDKVTCEKGMAFNFTREQSTFIIELYEQHLILYDVINENYKNKTRRLMALQEIQHDFNKKFKFVNISAEEIRKKINALRTQFFSEENKIKKSLTSGAGGGDIYQPSLWCYELLLFLRTSAPVRSGESNLTLPMETTQRQEVSQGQEIIFEGTVEELHSEHFIEALSPSGSIASNEDPKKKQLGPSFSDDTSRSTTPVTKKRRMAVKSVEVKTAALLEKATNLLDETSNAGPIDVIDGFLVSLGAELRGIKNVVRNRNLRRRIMDLVYEAQEEYEETENN